MGKYAYLTLLILMIGLTCGFNWGLGSAENCTDAKKLATALAVLTTEKRTSQEERIMKLCPEGASGHFVKGLRLERQGKAPEAIDEYRAAIEEDYDILPEAHGNLGLLLLNKGERDKAAVELTKGLLGRA